MNEERPTPLGPTPLEAPTLDWTMIIAEDDPELAGLLADGARRMLPDEVALLRAPTAALARQALDALSPDRHPRLVLLADHDLGGAGEAGVDLLADARARYPAARRVLMLSHDIHAERTEYAAADPHVVLRKPFGLRDAMASIAAIM